MHVTKPSIKNTTKDNRSGMTKSRFQTNVSNERTDSHGPSGTYSYRALPVQEGGRKLGGEKYSGRCVSKISGAGGGYSMGQCEPITKWTYNHKGGDKEKQRSQE